MTALNDVVARHTRWGFWKCFHRPRRAGHRWNHKRVHRVYCALRLNLPRRTKRRLPTRQRQPLVAPARLNETWALDFMADALYDGRGFRTLNIIDEGNREALAIEIGTSIPSARVIRVLDDLIRLYGRPARVRVDNGPELNNPIGIIATRIELMLEDAKFQPLPTEAVDDLHVLQRNIERVIRIAKGLLSFARQSPDEPALVDLNAVIEETLLLVGKQLGKDGVEADAMLDRAIGPVWGNGNELQQVLTNLLLNARDAMPRGGRVEIRTAPAAAREPRICLTIADTGDGMPSETLDKIWEAFYTTKQSGTGLGLSVSHRIILEHGGTVAVNSSPGQGMTFTILLPIHSTTNADHSCTQTPGAR